MAEMSKTGGASQIKLEYSENMLNLDIIFLGGWGDCYSVVGWWDETW